MVAGTPGETCQAAKIFGHPNANVQMDFSIRILTLSSCCIFLHRVLAFCPCVVTRSGAASCPIGDGYQHHDLMPSNASRRCNVSAISALTPPALSYPVVVMQRIKAKMGVLMEGSGADLISCAGPTLCTHYDERSCSASTTAEIKAYLYFLQPFPMHHMVLDQTTSRGRFQPGILLEKSFCL